MAFLDKAGLQTLTNKLVQGDAIKVASSRGNTVKNVIDNITRECSDVENPQTMTLEDETGHFMIGKGKDIDVSGDVEAGKMAFAFKGVTLQNCFDIFFRSVSYGATKKNNLITLDGTQAYSQANFLFPTNTTYTVYIKVVENSLPKGSHVSVNPYGGKLGKGYSEAMNKIKNGETGLMPAFTYEAKDHQGVGRNFWFEVGSHKLGGHLAAEFLILQGERTKKEIPPFFTGIKSSFETEEDRKIVHTGKNLWNDTTRFDRKDIRFKETFLKKGQVYTMSCKNIHREQPLLKDDYPAIRFTHIEPDGSETGKVVYFIKEGETITFTPQVDVNRVVLYSYKVDWVNSVGKFVSLENFQIEEGRGATEYAPYTKEEKIIELEEPLKSLPYGVCDEITQDGMLVRRVNKIVLTGTENWNSWEGYVNSDMIGAYASSIKDIKTDYSLEQKETLICDKLPIGTRGGNFSTRSTSFICRGGYYIGIVVRKDQLKTPDLQGLKDWIKKETPTVYYETVEREERVAKTQFDISQHNKIDISSTIAPTTTYKVPLNRAAQIDNSIKTIQELKQRIELLEQAYDNHFLESQYKLSLLKLEHQIESEEI